MEKARRLAQAAGALTIAIGFAHTAVGIAEYPWPSFDALWFHGTGIALFLIGALTILAASGRAWRPLIAVALAANVLGFAHAAAFNVLSHWHAPQGLVLMGIFAIARMGCVGVLTTRNSGVNTTPDFE